METLADLVFHLRDHWGDRRRLLARAESESTPAMSAAELVGDVHALALALKAGGLAAGTRVAIWADSRPGWHVVDLGIQLAGAASVALWPGASVERAAFVLRNSGASWLFADSARLARVEAVLPRLPSPPTVIRIDGSGAGSLTSLLGRGATLAAASPLERLRDTLDPRDMACLEYTPGTVTESRGVIRTHRAVTASLEPLGRALSFGPDDLALSITPLAHAAEREFGRAMLWAGVSVCYATTSAIATTIRAVRPTILISDARELEQVAAVMQRDWLVRTGRGHEQLDGSIDAAADWEAARAAGQSTLSVAVAGRLARRRLQPVLHVAGGRLRLALGFGSLTDDWVERLFRAIGVEAGRAYGFVEASPVLTVTTGPWRPGTVGRPLGEHRVHLGDDGEVLATGPGRAAGYWQDPETTAEMFEPEWLRSGDIGAIDRDGGVSVRGRAGELVTLSGATSTSLALIERRLALMPAIDRAVAVARGRSLGALVVPADRRRRALDSGAAWRDVKAALDQYNQTAPEPEAIDRFELLPRPLGQDTREITPAGSVRRRVVADLWAQEIEALFR